jgi:hypothetical protein
MRVFAGIISAIIAAFVMFIAAPTASAEPTCAVGDRMVNNCTVNPDGSMTLTATSRPEMECFTSPFVNDEMNAKAVRDCEAAIAAIDARSDQDSNQAILARGLLAAIVGSLLLYFAIRFVKNNSSESSNS